MATTPSLDRLSHKTWCGQATVELAYSLPIVVIVALIGINGWLFVSECAVFDELACQAIITHATSPAEVDRAVVASRIEQELSQAVSSQFSSVEVNSTQEESLERWTACLKFHPHFFTGSVKARVLGVPLFEIAHDMSLVVDPYAPALKEWL